MGSIKKLSFLLALLLMAGCSPENNSGLSGKIQLVSGLPPVAFLVNTIAGERAHCSAMLPEGRTPHDFTPRTPALRQAAQAKIFFTAGQSFEEKCAGFFRDKSTICDVSKNITRIHFSDGSGTHRHCDDTSCSSHTDSDPHFWLSAGNAVIMAENITSALIAADPAGRKYYLANCRKLQNSLLELDKNIRRDLAPFAGRTFFVYHPSFGYFARDYRLKQRAVELNGREVRTNQLAAVIREAKTANASTVFVQKQFNPRTAEALAHHIGGTVEFLDPLAYDLPANLARTAEALKSGFSREGKGI